MNSWNFKGDGWNLSFFSFPLTKLINISFWKYSVCKCTFVHPKYVNIKKVSQKLS